MTVPGSKDESSLLALRPTVWATYARAAELLLATEAARAGDPWPWIACQWGPLISAATRLACRERGEPEPAGITLDAFQVDIISSLFDPTIRQVFVKGNTGCGKGAAAAIVCCVYLSIYEDARIVVSRDSERSCLRQTFAEIARWWRAMASPPAGLTLRAKGIFDDTRPERCLSIANPKVGEGFSGCHSEHVLFVFDEATAPNLMPRYSLVETQAKKFLALANPRTTAGPFWAMFQRATAPDQTQTITAPTGRVRLVTVDGRQMLNVIARCLTRPLSPPGGVTLAGRDWPAGTILPADVFRLAAPLIPGQTCYDEYLALCQHADPDFVACMAHGRFPRFDRRTQLIRRDWLLAGHDLWSRWQRLWQRDSLTSASRRRLDRWLPVEAFGLDVSGSADGDLTVLTAGGQRGIRDQVSIRLGDAVSLVEWVLATARERFGVELPASQVPIGVDADGLGWGVISLLRKRGARVIECRGNQLSTINPREYRNQRAEVYSELARRLDPEGPFAGVDFALPANELLTEELCAPRKIYAADGLCYALTPKRPIPGQKDQRETLQQRLGRSPDFADSAVYFYRALSAAGTDLAELLDQLGYEADEPG